MTVSKIIGNGFTPDPVKIKKEKEAALSKSAHKDSAKVSDEAKLLFDAERAKKIREIEEKIESGYYMRREVTERVAEAMLSSVSKAPTTE